MLTDISDENRLALAKLIDDTFSQVDDFGTDVILTSTIQNILRKMNFNLDNETINQLLEHFEFKGDAIPGSGEKLWYVELK